MVNTIYTHYIITADVRYPLKRTVGTTVLLLPAGKNRDESHFGVQPAHGTIKQAFVQDTNIINRGPP